MTHKPPGARLGAFFMRARDAGMRERVTRVTASPRRRTSDKQPHTYAKIRPTTRTVPARPRTSRNVHK
jgi:hypothetical protein